MALRRTRALHFLDLAKSNSPPPPIPSSAAAADQSLTVLRRPLFSFPVAGDRPVEKFIRGGLNAGRMRLDLMISQSPAEVRMMLRASQMEAVRTRLGAAARSSVSCSEFLRICREESNSDESAAAVARSLEESVHVFTVGNLVFLHPREIVREMERVIPLQRSKREQIMKELKEMEAKKAEIDKKAAANVRLELCCGLGFLIAQTLGFFRLTFWELSWDVMEPICFYVTYIYFMAGYSFFLKTSRDPSLEGFFEIRFAEKQKRLLRVSNFDLSRFNELKQQANLFSTLR